MKFGNYKIDSFYLIMIISLEKTIKRLILVFDFDF